LRLSPERTVLAVGLLGGLLFAFVTPPFQAPDEAAHFRRIYQIAGGVPPLPGPGGEPGVMQPASLEKVIALCLAGLPGQPRRLLPKGAVQAAWNIPLDPGGQVFVPLEKLTAYNAVSYLPQAAAAAAGRGFELRPLATLYLIRLANLAACLALAWAAVRIVPFQRWAFALLALAPMAMFLRSSASADGLTFAAALLLTSTVCAIGVGKQAAAAAAPETPAAAAAAPDGSSADVAAPPGTPAEAAGSWPATGDAPEITPPEVPAPGISSAHLVVCLLTMTGVVAFCKVGYVVVNLLVAAIPRRRLGSPSRWAAVMSAASVLSALGIWNSLLIARLYAAHFRRAPFVQPLAQLHLMLAHPLHYLGLVSADYWIHLTRYAVGFVGNFGWLDTPLPVYVLVPYALLLAGLALTGGNPAAAMPRGTRLAAAAVVAGGLLILSTSQYLCWTPLGAQQIDGLQGRYFLPLAGAGILLLYNRRLARPRPPHGEARLAGRFAVASAVFTLVSLVRIWTRYHGL
jgi:uncharacterized membrane protein